MSEWSFPFARADLCQLVKIYLDKAKRTAPQFKENFPSLEWAERFIDRHKSELTERGCQNINSKSHIAGWIGYITRKNFQLRRQSQR